MASDSLYAAPEVVAAVLAASPDGVIAFDREFRYTTWNPAMEHLSGVSAAEALGRVAFDVFPFLVETGEDRHFREALAGRTGSSSDRPFTVPATGRSGFYEARYAPLRDPAGAVVGGVGVVRDVTEQVAAGHAVAAARDRAERSLRLHTLVLERMVEGVSVADESGTIVYTNPAEDQMFGYAPGELVGKHVTVQNTYPPEENARIVAEVIQQLKARGSWEGTWDNVKKDGTPFVTHARITALDLDGRPYWVCVQEDVTGRRRVDERIRRVQEVTSRLSGALTPEQVAAVVVEQGVAALGAQAGSIVRLSDDGSALEMVQAVGYSEELLARWQRVPLDLDVPLAEAARTRTPVFVDSREAWAARYSEAGPLRALSGSRAWAALPLGVEGRLLGVMGLSFTTPEPPGADERAFMMSLAQQCAQALERARLYEAERAARAEAERAERRVAFLAKASAELAASLEVADTLRTVARLAVPDLGDWCFVELFEDLDTGTGALKPVAIHHLDPARVALGWHVTTRYPLRPENQFGTVQVARTGEPALVTEIPDEALVHVAHDAEHLRILREIGFRSWVQVPLRIGARVVGVLSFVTDGASGRPYAAADVKLAEEIAARAGVALENARLYAAEREARQEAEAARIAAEEASRAKSEFLAVMSHELRTPLNAIAGYAELIELGVRGPTTAQQREDLARIRKSQKHLLGLINEVLNYARVESGTMEYELTVVLVADVMAAAESLVAPQMQAKGLGYSSVGCGAPLAVRADPEKMQQVLLNLLSNAMKFTGRGGRVEVTCETAGGHVLIRVCDTGVGIPAEKLESVFEPFVQVGRALNNPTEGTGLGLAISRDLARGMGGDIRVESEPGRGSTFTFALPAAHVA
ncbi:MAG TPA: ATP-binding protein [Gemmatimonadaceae bacterium]|nr:ATP-binding protein [Gemmatimonadaceae bacterium]